MKNYTFVKFRKDVVSSWNNFSCWCRSYKLMNTRAPVGMMYIPTDYEHCANTMSHALMVAPSILVSELLILRSEEKFPIHQNYWSCRTPPCLKPSKDVAQGSYTTYEFCSRAYGAVLVSLFLVSSIFHWISWTQSKWKKMHAGCCVRRPSLSKLFHLCDRTTIFFFIAGSYSPWLMLQEIHHSILWMQWFVWVAAIFGTFYTFIFLEKYKLFETILYICVAMVPGLVAYSVDPTHHSASCFKELGTGGIFYLVGVIFFKLDGALPFAHAIWHLFVAAGASAHLYSTYSHFYTLNYQAI